MLATTWTHVLDGLGVIADWQTWVAAVEYLLVSLLMPIGAALLFTRRPDAEAGSGCLMLVMVPVLEVWAMVVFVMTLAPVVLGVSQDADWSLPFRAMYASASNASGMLGGLTLLALIMNAVPFLRRQWALHAFVLGSIVAVFSIGFVAPADGDTGATVAWLPDVVTCAAILVLVVAASLLDELVVAAAHGLLGRPPGPVSYLIVSPLSALPGFVPVFVYGAWLGAQL